MRQSRAGTIKCVQTHSLRLPRPVCALVVAMTRGVAPWEYGGLVNREKLFLREDAVKGAGEFCFCAAAEGGAVSIVSGE